MARVLAISSQVVRGHVGLSAIVPALQRLGHEVLAIPTVLLSNHPGHKRAAGMRIEVNTLMGMLDVLDANGWLAGIDAVMTGYLPTEAHVGFAVRAIERSRTRHSSPLVIVDPVAGDDPRGLYIAEDAADALRTRLVPLAAVVTPNRFELSWLSGETVEDAASAAQAAQRLAPATVIATSVPDGKGSIANVCVGASARVICRVERAATAPNGTGDLLSGLFAGNVLNGRNDAEAMARAVAGVKRAVAASAGANDLVLTGIGRDDWSAAQALPTEVLA